MDRALTALRLTLVLSVASLAQQVTSITTVATYNNVGIEVVFSAAPAAGTAISVAWDTSPASGTWHNGHPLSRVATDRFAGSVFWLTPNTAYVIRLSSSAFSRDTVINTTTRSDAFPQPTGTVYHVAKSGSDSRDGSSLAQAFATLGHAVSLAQAGATILLHAGHYYEEVSLPRSGTANAPILIRNAPGEKAVLDGRDTTFRPVWSVYNVGAGIYRAACTALPGLAFLNGQHLFASPTLADLVANTWSMPAGYFADGSYLYVHLPGGAAPSAADTVAIPAYTTAITVAGRDYIQIKGVEICYYGLNEYPRAIYFDGASYNVVDSCYLHHNCIGVAFKRACRFNTVQRCDFTEAPIDIWNWSAVKEGTGYYEAGGVVVYGSPSVNTGNVVRENHFFHMFDGSHLYSEDGAGPTSNMDFHDNVIEFVNDDCIETDGAGTNCRIYSNTFRSFLTGISVAPAAGGPTYIMRDLLTDWETHSGYVGYPFKFNVSSSLTIDWVYLYHNTCYTAVAGQPGFLFKQYSNWNNVISRNNIYAGTDYALESSSSQNPVDFDYDDLYTTASGRLVRWAGSSYTTVAAFTGATGQERHGLNRNPQFAAPGSDYRLSGSSLLIDSGVVIAGINDGYVGNGPDIGRYERGADPVMARSGGRSGGAPSLAVCANPAKGRVSLRVSSDAVAAIRVYTVAGKLVFRSMVVRGETIVAWDSRDCGPGRYIARLASGGADCRQEFVVVR